MAACYFALSSQSSCTFFKKHPEARHACVPLSAYSVPVLRQLAGSTRSLDSQILSPIKYSAPRAKAAGSTRSLGCQILSPIKNSAPHAKAAAGDHASVPSSASTYSVLSQLAGSSRFLDCQVLSPIRFSAPRAKAAAGFHFGGEPPDLYGGPTDFEFSYAPIYITPNESSILAPMTLLPHLTSLRSAGVRGLLIDMHWGEVESEPMVYHWEHYVAVMEMARAVGLKVRVVLAFHGGGAPEDRFQLPFWVQKEMERDPHLAFHNKSGRKSTSYISFGADNVPALKGRTPIQAYAEFMIAFTNRFKNFFGDVIQDVQISLGPDGELKFPSGQDDSVCGEFQCYDNYMRASLQQFASDRGVPEWGSYIPDEKEFLSNAGWKTEHGRFFLEWYSGILVSHAECILRQAQQCLSHVGISAKVAKNLYQEYYEFEAPLFTWTAGYYCIPLRNMYTRIAVVFGRYAINLCCPDCGLDDDRVDKVFGLWFGMSMGESTRVSGAKIMAGEISMPGSESFDEVLAARLARLYNFLHHFKTALELSVTVKLSFNFRVSRIEDFKVAEYRKFLRSFYAGILG